MALALNEALRMLLVLRIRTLSNTASLPEWYVELFSGPSK